jgi:type I restriction enzyme S subunit
VAETRTLTAFNQGCRGLVPTRSIDVGFYRYVIVGMVEQLQAAGQGSTFEELSGDGLAQLRVPMPPIRVQRAIADYLDTETARIDALITKKRRMIDLIGERRRSAAAAWRHRLESDTRQVSLRRWLSRVEQGWSPVCDSETASVGEWGVLKTSAVSGGVFRPEENKRLPSETAPDLRWAVEEGDLLVTRGSGSPAAVAVACVAHPGDRKLTISDLIYRLTLVGADADFVAMWIGTPQARSQIEASIRTDSGQTLKVRVDDLKDLTVPDISATDQRIAAAEWSAHTIQLEQAMELLQHQIGLLLEHRQALITAAVTGELEVPGVAA